MVRARVPYGAHTPDYHMMRTRWEVGGPGAVAARAARRAGPDYKGWGQRVRAERTRNIWFMFVTLEVTQLEMSALKFCKL